CGLAGLVAEGSWRERNLRGRWTVHRTLFILRACGSYAARVCRGRTVIIILTLSRPRNRVGGVSQVVWRLSHHAKAVRDRCRNLEGGVVALVDVKQLLDAGVHYGHRASRWNPK